MIRAMSQTDPPLVIEDLVRFGEDRGYERGRNEGLDAGRVELRRSVLELLEARGIEIEPGVRARIATENDLERLRGWIRRAALATSAVEVFE
jgi:hypothetical protein